MQHHSQQQQQQQQQQQPHLFLKAHQAQYNSHYHHIHPTHQYGHHQVCYMNDIMELRYLNRTLRQFFPHLRNIEVQSNHAGPPPDCLRESRLDRRHHAAGDSPRTHLPRHQGVPRHDDHQLGGRGRHVAQGRYPTQYCREFH